MAALTSGPKTRPLQDQASSAPHDPVVPDDCAQKPQRNEAVDVIRLIAAASIVYVHSVRTQALSQWGNLLRFAVPFFRSYWRNKPTELLDHLTRYAPGHQKAMASGLAGLGMKT